jgi:hypothetical protein
VHFEVRAFQTIGEFLKAPEPRRHKKHIDGRETKQR